MVVELDEERKDILYNPEKQNQFRFDQLIIDLFKLETYKDPISLFARFGTRCMSYLSQPGQEFYMASKAAHEKTLERKQKLKENENNINGIHTVNTKYSECKVVFGDQKMSLTMASIRKATPLWMVLTFNMILFFIYFWPLIDSFYCALQSLYINVTKIELLQREMIRYLIAFILWQMIFYPVGLILKVMVEKSKARNGMKRVNKCLTAGGTALPCLKKTLKKSDLKLTRDVILATNTINEAWKYSNNDLIIAVIGLAHMENMSIVARESINGKLV